jgi:diguanylate cyclase (GGDEF)-like protein
MSTIEQLPGQKPWQEMHEGHPVLSIEQLIRERNTDELTGLPNRRYARENLPRIIEENKGHVGILFIDLDRFKEINDTLGHEAGDEHLKKVATKLRTSDDKRSSDMIVRWGGDEFLAILTGIEEDDDLEAARSRIQKAVDTVGNGGTVGAARYTHDLPKPTDIINNADTDAQSRKIHKKLEEATETQLAAYEKIGDIALKANISERDIPGILEALRQNQTS